MVYAEQIPDYYNPYAPIFTNKEVYTWTDKVKITIVAPSWNAHKSAIDTIGTDEGHFIKLSTSKDSLEPYKLTETDLNSGIFVGEVTLTGFSHDVDGDGDFDTNPRTTGSGPTNGFLESERDDAITISFEFADGVVLTQSAHINWNIGTIKFLESEYDVDKTATIRAIDPDMNLNPESIDQIMLEISSDSDTAGISVAALETNENTGVFEATITFTQNSVSSGNRLFAIPGDAIYGKYEDRTLPKPHSTSDELDVLTTSSFKSNIFPTERISHEGIVIADDSGNALEEVNVNNRAQIVGTILNNQNFQQNFVYILQISDENGKVDSLSWIRGQLNANQKLELAQSWSPTKTGEYKVETFVWESLQKPIPVSSLFSKTYVVD